MILIKQLLLPRLLLLLPRLLLLLLPSIQILKQQCDGFQLQHIISYKIGLKFVISLINIVRKNIIKHVQMLYILSHINSIILLKSSKMKIIRNPYNTVKNIIKIHEVSKMKVIRNPNNTLTKSLKFKKVLKIHKLLSYNCLHNRQINH